MKKIDSGIYAILILFLVGFAACSTSEYKGFKKTHSGIYYKIHTKDNEDTVKVALGKVITMDMKYSTVDSVIYDNKAINQTIRFPLQTPEYEGDIYEALALLVKGDSATFIIDAASFFTQTAKQPSPPTFLKEGDKLYFDVLIKDVQTEEDIQAENNARLDSLKAIEPGLIAQYIADHQITAIPDSNGIYYIEKEAGKGKQAAKEMWVDVHYSVSMLNGAVLFNSRDRGADPMQFQVGNRFENDGFQLVVQKMKKGGKAEALIPSLLAFGAQGAGDVVPPYTPLYYNIELVDVMTMDEWDRKRTDKLAMDAAEKLKKQNAEKEAIAKYIADNGYTPTEQLPTGITYIEQVKGAGPKPVNKETVKVHYTGRLLDGTKFDSSVDRGEPFSFTIGMGQVILGWDKGIPLMTVGSKGLLIVPFDQGYGDRQAGSIPPFSTLVFEVELLEIVK